MNKSCYYTGRQELFYHLLNGQTGNCKNMWFTHAFYLKVKETEILVLFLMDKKYHIELKCNTNFYLFLVFVDNSATV